jgi:uncharacterized protein YaaW (UPF0174 family)
MFGLKYRPDSGLEFLQLCSHEELRDLADILILDEGGPRLTEILSSDGRFVQGRNTDLTACWDVIAAEFQRFGADSFGTMVRGGTGVEYRTILNRVAHRFDIDADKGESYDVTELKILTKLFDHVLTHSNEEQRARLYECLRDIAGTEPHLRDLAPAAMMAAVKAAIANGGFAAYRWSAVAANAVARAVLGRGLSVSMNAALMRLLSAFAGPLGWGISALLTLPTITGPAYRVIVPATIMVAHLRQVRINTELV